MDTVAAEAGLMTMPLPTLGSLIVHVAYWATASAANVLVSIAFRVPDPPPFNMAECALCFAATAEVRALGAETESLRNELRHLQSQITPPFLFNALNTLPAAAFGRISRSLIIHLATIRATQWQSRHLTLICFHGVAAPMPLDRAGTTRLKKLVQS